RHDQAALPLADRRQQVHNAHRQWLLAGLQADALVRVDRRQLVEIAVRKLFGGQALDGGHVFYPRPRAALARLRRPGNLHALSQLELLNQTLIDKGVARLRDVVLGRVAQEAVALVVELEDALSGSHDSSGFAARGGYTLRCCVVASKVRSGSGTSW